MAKSAGKYFTETALGNVYAVSTAVTGVAFPIATGVALTLGLWNTSTTKNAVLIGLNLGYTSGTITVGAIGILNQFVGFNVGTSHPLAAITASVPKNMLLGGGKSSAMTAFGATATLTAGGSAAWWSGISHEIATASPGFTNCKIDFDGQVIVTPGQIIAVCDSIAQTGLFTGSLIWSEVDIAG